LAEANSPAISSLFAGLTPANKRRLGAEMLEELAARLRAG